MNQNINKELLKAISRHHQKLGLKYFIKGLNYERCAELPYIIGLLQNRFGEALKYLDIGSGEAPLPTYLLKESEWDITCVDKFSWVQQQKQHAARVMNGRSVEDRFHIIEKDFFEAGLAPESFDVITNISVIEHFEGNLDSKAMAASAKLLKPGGEYILTTLVNEGYFKEFYLNQNVYGESYQDKSVFYQRHYDLASLEERLIKPTGLKEVGRVYFGDYGFQGFENIFHKSPKALRAFYQWAMPLFASRFLTYSLAPISRKEMLMNTASGVILVLEK